MDRGDDLGTRADALMEGLSADRGRLTAIPSAVVPYARAEPHLRFHPEQDPREARGPLVTRPEPLRPSGIPLTVTPGDTGPGCEPATDGPACLREGRASEPAFVASGGPPPLVNGPAKAVPDERAKAADSAGGAA
ncbi:hypothetical protein ACFYUM_24955 [Streptomyces fimicarius]|uniref:hypothetical protein n=1 Tax=Streptomyces griseus TaxID=1911 RepID=UPI00368C79D7